MTLTVSADGWVEGATRRPVPFHTRNWPYGPPQGVVLHFQGGCGDPFAAFMERKVSAHCSIQRDASIIQYVSLADMAWHAYDASHRFLGIESAASPGPCDWTEEMLERMAELAAACMNWAAQRFGAQIPTVRSPGKALLPGVKCHADGLEPGSVWDPNGHWDAPWKAEGDPIDGWIWKAARDGLNQSPWTSEQMLQAITRYRGEEEELALLSEQDQEDLKVFLDTLRDKLRQVKDPDKPAAPKGAAQRVARTVLDAEESNPSPGQG